MVRRLAAWLLPLAFAFSFVPAAAARAPDIAEDARNPPPPVALSSFDRFHVEPVAMSEAIARHKGNVVARQYLQVDLDERIPKLVEPWNARAEGQGRTLLVKPEIEAIRFITGGKRLLAGGFAGNSWAVLRLRLVDADSGELIAEPRFYQRAYGIFAGYSLGAADKLMLARLSDMAAAYLRDNFDAPRGSTVATSTAKMD
jgi:hypothetical protein